MDAYTCVMLARSIVPAEWPADRKTRLHLTFGKAEEDEQRSSIQELMV
jgi:hypothetical protein